MWYTKCAAVVMLDLQSLPFSHPHPDLFPRLISSVFRRYSPCLLISIYHFHPSCLVSALLSTGETTIFFSSTHVIDVSFYPSTSVPLMTFPSWVSITVRQTRNHLVADVQYVALKKIILPDPLAVQCVTLSKLGFGKPTQKFKVCWIFSFPSNLAT